jgi:tetratricopeptide (TPR) repeat protein
LRARSHLRLGNYDGAVADATRAIELDRSMSGAYETRGLGYLRSRQYEKAVLDFSRTMESDPANAMAYVNRGLAYLFLNRDQDAEADFRIAVSRGIDAARIEAGKEGVRRQRSVQ